MTTLATRKDRKGRTAALAGLIALAMLALGFAAVPLYRLFCQVTGYGGTTMRVTEAESAAIQTAVGKTVTVRFDSNVAPTLPWDFRPEQPRETITIGARDMMIFLAKNRSDHTLKGTATFNVTPEAAGKYFSKIQCFCFTEQELKAGEQVRMPVIYYVDPKILDDPDTKNITEITLSYTFFPVDETKKGS